MRRNPDLEGESAKMTRHIFRRKLWNRKRNFENLVATKMISGRLPGDLGRRIVAVANECYLEMLKED